MADNIINLASRKQKRETLTAAYSRILCDAVRGMRQLGADTKQISSLLRVVAKAVEAYGDPPRDGGKAA
jgi:glucose-6-phosphate 1-dehydrogenase